MTRREWRGLQLVDVDPREREDDGRGVLDDEQSGPFESFESFDTFYLREFPRLVAFARALTGDAHAQDIAQESMVVAYGKWNEVSQYASPAGWVRGVCSNKAASSVRRSSAERRALDRLRMRRPTALTALPDEDDTFWREVRRLPHRQTQVVALFYALDMSVVDIAATLDCSEGTVKAHLSHARSTLAKRLGVREEVRR